MQFIKVASTEDLLPDKMKKVMFENAAVLLANLDGDYYAIEDTCPHMGGSLSLGKLEGKNVVCPKHGAKFDVTTGKVISNGKLLFITAKVHDLKSYTVKIDGTDILLGNE